MKKIWQTRNFLPVLLISAGLGVSQQIYNIAVPIIVYYLTHSPLLMSAIRGMEYIPNILLAILIGVVIDRTQPGKIFKLSIIGQFIALLSLFIGFKFIFNWKLFSFIMVFLLMSCTITFNNIRTLIIKISIDKSLLTEANSVLQIAAQLIQVLGPAFTGLVLFFADPRYSLVICSIILAVTVLMSFNIKIPDRKIALQEKILHSIKEAWDFLYRDKIFFSLVVLAVFINCSETMTTIMYIVLAKTTLNLENFDVGILFSAFGLGGIIGGIAMDHLSKIINKLTLMKYGILISATFYILLFFFQNFSLTLVVMLVEGFSATIIALVIWIYRQESTPQQFMGRVTGLTSTIFKCGMPFASILAGIIAEKWGVKYIFLLSFFINLSAFIAFHFSIINKSTELPLS